MRTPRETRARAVRSLASPAPSKRTLHLLRSPKIFPASSTVTVHNGSGLTASADFHAVADASPDNPRTQMFEVRLRTRDGAYRAVQGQATLRFHHGRAVAVEITGRDVTRTRAAGGFSPAWASDVPSAGRSALSRFMTRV